MAVELGRFGKLRDIKHIPIGIDVIVVRRLPIRGVDTTDEHPVIHREVGVVMLLGLPCIVRIQIAQGGEEHSPMMVQFIEGVISIGDIADLTLRKSCLCCVIKEIPYFGTGLSTKAFGTQNELSDFGLTCRCNVGVDVAHRDFRGFYIRNSGMLGNPKEQLRSAFIVEHDLVKHLLISSLMNILNDIIHKLLSKATTSPEVVGTTSVERSLMRNNLAHIHAINNIHGVVNVVRKRRRRDRVNDPSDDPIKDPFVSGPIQGKTHGALIKDYQRDTNIPNGHRDQRVLVFE